MRDYAVVLPVLLDLDLVSAGWNGATSPYPGMSARQYAMQALRKSFMKKFTNGRTSASADAAALSAFLDANGRCGGCYPDTSQHSEIDAIVLGEAKEFLHRFFYPDEDCILTWSRIAHNVGVGNGSNIGSFSTDLLSKFGTSHMTATDPFLHSIYVEAIRHHPIWSSVESTRSKIRGERLVKGSRLSFVAKTTEISRSICTEPLCNMMIQKGIAHVLESRLEQHVGISLSSQPDKNRRLARIGSQTQRFGTIDLKQASDSVSLSLVRSLLPPEVVTFLMRSRSPVTILPDGSEVDLQMVSSMGNAFTFPLETLLFTAVVYGVYRALSIKFERPTRYQLGNFAVFGDDIIVESRAYNLVIKTLESFGFLVNVDKSFNEGLFRESCGHDYYDGHQVRGVYLQKLRTDSDRYSAINRLNRWSSSNGILLVHTIGYLSHKLRILPVPLDESDDSGIKLPLRALRRRRYCRRTSGIQYRAVVHETPSYDVTDVVERKPKLRGWINNPDAVLLAAIAGTLRDGRVKPRPIGLARPKLKVRYSSSWDYDPPGGRLYHLGDGWQSVFELNLNLYEVGQSG